jgi:hypothetical protein
VEIGAHFFSRDDANRGRQKSVEGTLQFFRGELRLRFETCDLAERVDAGVCSAGAVNGYLFLSDFAEYIGDCALNGGDAGLDLPAVECGAVISKGQFDVTHAEQIIARRKQFRRKLNELEGTSSGMTARDDKASAASGC